MSWPPIPAHGFGIPRLPPPAKLYVDLDNDARLVSRVMGNKHVTTNGPCLTMRIGPKGKVSVTTVKELIMFAAARCGKYGF